MQCTLALAGTLALWYSGTLALWYPGTYLDSIAMHSCYCITAPGLEPLAARELSALGITPGEIEPGGIAFEGSTSHLYAANLHLRTVSRIVVRIAEFRARTFPELERHAGKLPWGEFIRSNGSAAFRVTSKKSKLYHQGGIAERLGRALMASVAGATLSTQAPLEEAESSDQLFLVRALRDVFTISADASGELLHRRGYRLATAKAPMRETLAAAGLAGADWDGSTALADPFCGSGTIAIEAALVARRIPPGWRRRFAFESWPTFESDVWKAVRKSAEAGLLARSRVPIIASDRDAGAIAAAEANATRAGVRDDIEFVGRALSKFESPARTGTLITNPPYGVRIGDERKLRDLFAALGNLAEERLPQWTIAWFSANPRLAAATGLSFEERFRTTNGGIPVRLLVAPAATLPRT